MTRKIDTETGLAAFRQGRSLCVRLQGQLDASAARGIERIARSDDNAVRFRLECSSLEGVEPVGARLLAHALLTWSGERSGRSVDLINLDPELQRRVAWHPLRAFIDPDELVFFDPGRDYDSELMPSRH